MKITMKTSKTMKEFFDDFIIAKKAQGLADKTIKSYQSQFRAINNHLDVNVPIEDITKSDLEKMVTSMRNSNLAANSISTYVRILRVFLSWCRISVLGYCKSALKQWLPRCNNTQHTKSRR